MHSHASLADAETQHQTQHHTQRSRSSDLEEVGHVAAATALHVAQQPPQLLAQPGATQPASVSIV
eukprot:1437344-Rhodomonas_salina.2